MENEIHKRGKIIWSIIAAVIIIIGFVATYHQILSFIDQKIENKILDSAFIRKVASKIHPTIIFNSEGAIIVDMGGEKYISELKVEKVEDSGSGNTYKIIVSPKEYMNHPPLLSTADANLYLIKKINRIKKIDFEYILERFISWEEEGTPSEFRLEIIP